MASIVVQGASSRTLAAAIRDPARYVRETTGAELPQAKSVSESGNAISVSVVGGNDGLPREGFIVRTKPNTVEIVGSDPDGAAWGIYDFLERHVGVRWHWPEYKNEPGTCGTSLQKTPDLVVPPVHYSDAPAFPKRTRWPSGGRNIGQAQMGDHGRHLRCGNTWPIELIVHAPHDWAAIYKESRPEIFQLRKGGGRDFEMLCYGNSLTLQTYLEEIELQLSGEVKAGRKRTVICGKAIPVSPADMAVSCRCGHCRKLWDDNGGSYGTASRVMGTFVANLGREVKKRWPDMTVVFLPYRNYTYAPSGIDFPNNVQIQICGMPGMALYKDRRINAAEQANIDAWVELSGRRIQNWHYSCWPANRTEAAYLFPHTVQAHYQANREKTVGTFINGVGDHWPRQHLSLYVWLKVLWNPDIDVDAVIDEHCRRMYGAAADPMRRLVGLLIDRWEKVNWEPHVLSPRTVYEQSFPPEVVEQIEALFAEAQKLAAGDELVTRRLAYYGKPLQAFFDESRLLADGGGVKPLNVYQIAEEMVIDGKLDEKGWQGIEPVDFTRLSRKPEETRFPTALKAVWSRQGTTFGFRMAEPEVEKLKRDIGKESRDASLIWWNDNVGIFLDPSGQRSGYYQFIVNANGAIFDSIGRENTAWNAEGVVAAGHVGEGLWSCEIFIPCDCFEKPVLLPATGVEWYGNFCRHRVTDRKNREYQGFSISSGAPSHNQNAFGPLKFVER